MQPAKMLLLAGFKRISYSFCTEKGKEKKGFVMDKKYDVRHV
jgi:hypothetical protein